MWYTKSPLNSVGPPVKMIKEFDPECKSHNDFFHGPGVLCKDAILAGAKGFIVKPFKEDYVIQAIENYNSMEVVI